jgi:sulfite exporter TauE/SafE/copper chaperone CopZ
MSRTYTFYSPEMHCGACELVVTRTLQAEQHVHVVKANAALSTVHIEGDFDEGPDEIARRLSELLHPQGYTLTVRAASRKLRPRGTEFLVALLFSSLIIAGFIWLQKAGLVKLFNPDEMNLTAAFLIGVIASLSSCMALVGGLLLSVAANSSRTNPGARLSGNAMFHASRLISFFVLGGVIGAIGKAFTLTPVISVVLNGAVALFMLILGLNLLDLFPVLKKLQPRMPSFLARRVLRAEKVRNALAPALLGLITFFLPCGFTQSMQLFSLTAGSFMNGALTMLAFAAGTFPVLALISLASVNLSASRRSGIFFKTAGLIVIAFALVNLMSSFVVLGLIRPMVNI